MLIVKGPCFLTFCDEFLLTKSTFEQNGSEKFTSSDIFTLLHSKFTPQMLAFCKIGYEIRIRFFSSVFISCPEWAFCARFTSRLLNKANQR